MEGLPEDRKKHRASCQKELDKQVRLAKSLMHRLLKSCNSDYEAARVCAILAGMIACLADDDKHQQIWVLRFIAQQSQQFLPLLVASSSGVQ